MAIPLDTPAPLAVLRGLGLVPVLAPDGRTFTVKGLGSLPVDTADEVRALCRQRRADILRALGEEVVDAGLEEARRAEKAARWDARQFWPLQRRYTSTAHIAEVVRAWGLRLETDGDDFRLTEPCARETRQHLPGLWIFCRANGGLINRWLREVAHV